MFLASTLNLLDCSFTTVPSLIERSVWNFVPLKIAWIRRARSRDANQNTIPSDEKKMNVALHGACAQVFHSERKKTRKWHKQGCNSGPWDMVRASVYASHLNTMSKSLLFSALKSDLLDSLPRLVSQLEYRYGNFIFGLRVFWGSCKTIHVSTTLAVTPRYENDPKLCVYSKFEVGFACLFNSVGMRFVLLVNRWQNKACVFMMSYRFLFN